MNRSLPFLVLLVSALQGVGCVVNSTDESPCDPNPCNQANRGVCVDEAGEARCLCDTGFISRPNGVCEAASASNCPEHFGDAAEPDDCQVRARPIASKNVSLSQSIEPAGDYDFFQFSASARELYSISVRVDGGALMPRVDVFDQGGVWLDAGETAGRTDFFFRANTASIYYARVSHSPVDPSVGIGGYTISFTSLGEEDHGNAPDVATAITADPLSTSSPRSTFGSFEYSRDEDWFRFEGTAGRTYRLLFDPGSSSAPRMIPAATVFAGSNLRQPLAASQGTELIFTLPVSGSIFVILTPPTSATGPGTYAFNFLVN